eukprot:6580882-Prymnesium_polylepis.1
MGAWAAWRAHHRGGRLACSRIRPIPFASCPPFFQTRTPTFECVISKLTGFVMPLSTENLATRPTTRRGQG